MATLVRVIKYATLELSFVTWIILTTWCSWTCHVILNLWSCVLVIWWLLYMTLLVQGASCSLYTSHSIHT